MPHNASELRSEDPVENYQYLRDVFYDQDAVSKVPWRNNADLLQSDIETAPPPTTRFEQFQRFRVLQRLGSIHAGVTRGERPELITKGRGEVKKLIRARTDVIALSEGYFEPEEIIEASLNIRTRKRATRLCAAAVALVYMSGLGGGDEESSQGLNKPYVQTMDVVTYDLYPSQPDAVVEVAAEATTTTAPDQTTTTTEGVTEPPVEVQAATVVTSPPETVPAPPPAPAPTTTTTTSPPATTTTTTSPPATVQPFDQLHFGRVYSYSLKEGQSLSELIRDEINPLTKESFDVPTIVAYNPGIGNPHKLQAGTIIYAKDCPRANGALIHAGESESEFEVNNGLKPGDADRLNNGNFIANTGLCGRIRL